MRASFESVLVADTGARLLALFEWPHGNRNWDFRHRARRSLKSSACNHLGRYRFNLAAAIPGLLPRSPCDVIELLHISHRFQALGPHISGRLSKARPQSLPHSFWPNSCLIFPTTTGLLFAPPTANAFSPHATLLSAPAWGLAFFITCPVSRAGRSVPYARPLDADVNDYRRTGAWPGHYVKGRKETGA